MGSGFGFSFKKILLIDVDDKIFVDDRYEKKLREQTKYILIQGGKTLAQKNLTSRLKLKTSIWDSSNS